MLDMRNKVGIQPMREKRKVEDEGAKSEDRASRPKKSRKASRKSREGCKICKFVPTY